MTSVDLLSRLNHYKLTPSNNNSSFSFSPLSCFLNIKTPIKSTSLIGGCPLSRIHSPKNWGSIFISTTEYQCLPLFKFHLLAHFLTCFLCCLPVRSLHFLRFKSFLWRAVNLNYKLQVKLQINCSGLSIVWSLCNSTTLLTTPCFPRTWWRTLPFFHSPRSFSFADLRSFNNFVMNSLTF